MTEKTEQDQGDTELKTDSDAELEQETEQEDAAAEGGADSDEDSDELSVLRAKYEEQAALAKENQEQRLRAYAELENYKRRKDQEVDNFKKYASEKTIREFIPVIDSLHNAFDVSNGTGSEEQMKEGLQLIDKLLGDIFTRLNVTEIEALDQPFNPDVHQAVMQEEKEGVDEGIVIKVLQKGYVLSDRVLRPAMVVVSK